MQINIDEIFVKRLTSERLRLKLSRKEVAACMGVQPQTLIQYEKGLSSPTVSNVKKLKQLAFDIDYLFNIERTSLANINNMRIKEVTDKVKKISSILGTTLTDKQQLELALILL